MDELNTELQKFNLTNLTNKISKVVPLEKQNLRKELKEYIWPRLDFMHGKSHKADRYFVLEESYVETEWKDMISVHYINTSYKVQNTVMRVHLFLKAEISESYYVGFFTLRKIDEARIILSYIYPNWSLIHFQGDFLNVMTYKKRVHILGKEIEYSTYPLFVQDNNTVACAEASMISMSQYLHNKFDYNKIRILDLTKAYSSGKTKLYPSDGLRPSQMVEIFNYYSIPVGYQILLDESEDSYAYFRNYVDYSVESAMPVILGLIMCDSDKEAKHHIVQIIGHTKNDRMQYVIYDDSGYFLRNGLGYNGFVTAATWDELKKFMKKKKSFLIYPIHEKVYILYDQIRTMFLDMFDKSQNLRELEENNISKVKNTRILLADNREVKSFLNTDILHNENVSQTVLEEELRLIKLDMPHYLWVCEVPLENGYLLFLADPTYARATTKNIFLNRIPILRQHSFGLLKY